MPFDVCWQRISRAKAHSDAFGKKWSTLIAEDDAYEIHVPVDDDGTGSIWIERRFGELSPIFALELGETLYQLRAALDGCIYEAVILESGRDPPHNEQALEFPICTIADQFSKSRRKTRPLTNEHRLKIIESVQPYNAPPLPEELMVYNINRSLAILNDWARKDRHRKLHVIGSWASNADPKFRLPEDTHLAHLMVTHDGFLEHQSEIASFRIEGWKRGMPLEANPDVFIDIAVDESPSACADNDTLGNRIVAMGVAVQSIVTEFEKSFDLRVRKPVF